jgi:hypothetical protein
MVPVRHVTGWESVRVDPDTHPFPTVQVSSPGGHRPDSETNPNACDLPWCARSRSTLGPRRFGQMRLDAWRRARAVAVPRPAPGGRVVGSRLWPLLGPAVLLLLMLSLLISDYGMILRQRP